MSAAQICSDDREVANKIIHTLHCYNLLQEAEWTIEVKSFVVSEFQVFVTPTQAVNTSSSCCLNIQNLTKTLLKCAAAGVFYLEPCKQVLMMIKTQTDTCVQYNLETW